MARSGSVDAYLRESDPQWLLPVASVDAPPFFQASMPRSHWRTTLNQFPSDGPRDVQHMLIKSVVPMLDRSLAADDAEWADVVERGVVILTGLPEHATSGVGLNVGSELRKAVVALWPEDRFETIAFVNRVSWQSVRGISHAHVLVRAKTPS